MKEQMVDRLRILNRSISELREMGRWVDYIAGESDIRQENDTSST
jgi:hypothetical protein